MVRPNTLCSPGTQQVRCLKMPVAGVGRVVNGGEDSSGVPVRGTRRVTLRDETEMPPVSSPWRWERPPQQQYPQNRLLLGARAHPGSVGGGGPRTPGRRQHRLSQVPTPARGGRSSHPDPSWGAGPPVAVRPAAGKLKVVSESEYSFFLLAKNIS